MRDYVSLLRPRQYLKNGFVVAPLLFAQELFHSAKVLAALLAFVAFCLASSFVYIVNDIADREEDRLHPRKNRYGKKDHVRFYRSSKKPFRHDIYY